MLDSVVQFPCGFQLSEARSKYVNKKGSPYNSCVGEVIVSQRRRSEVRTCAFTSELLDDGRE